MPATIAELPLFAAGRFPRPDLMGACREGGIVWTGGREFLDIVRDISLGLRAMGLERGDRVALLSESRPEWVFADLAVLSAGAVTTPIYPTLSAEQVEFILRDCGASLAVVSTPALAALVRSVAPRLPALRTIIAIDGPVNDSDDVPVVSLAAVASEGHQRIRQGWGVARDYQDRARSVRPDDLATIVYTSGTTGDPKGVMLTHGNLVANITGVLDVLSLGPDDVALSFLPLSHAFERIVTYIYLASGVSMVFAEAIDTVARDLLVVRPTVMTGVPRVFEKLQARIVEKAQAASPLRRRLFDWAVGLALERGRRVPVGEPLSLATRLGLRLADRLVFAKIRAAVGGRLRFAVSGSAALNPDIAAFFYGVGLPILEGYGLTETAPVLTVVPLETIRFGTVGRALPNVEIAIAPDGEILARGPNIMRGYYQRPEETALAIRDGWFHTGDIGTRDEDGFLRLTDRKKEILVTSGGKKIAPQPIEARLRSEELVGEAVLVGDRRHFPAVLIVPDFAVLGRRLGADPATVRTRLADEEVVALYQRIVDVANVQLAQFERIKKFALLGDEFSLAGGEFTPTLKVKRRIVEEKYRAVIEALYT